MASEEIFLLNLDNFYIVLILSNNTFDLNLTSCFSKILFSSFFYSINVLNPLITDIISFIGYIKYLSHERKCPLWPDLSPVLCIWRKIFLQDRGEWQQDKLSNGTVDWEHNGQYQTVYRCYTWPLSQCQIFAWKIKSIIYSHVMIFFSKIFWSWLHFNNRLLLKIDFLFEEHVHLCR